MSLSLMHLEGYPILSSPDSSTRNGYEHTGEPNQYLVVSRMQVGGRNVAMPPSHCPTIHSRSIAIDPVIADRMVDYANLCFDPETTHSRNCAGFVLNILGYTAQTYVDIAEQIKPLEDPLPITDKLETGKPYGFGMNGFMYHFGLGLDEATMISVDGYKGPLVIGPPAYFRYGLGQIYDLNNKIDFSPSSGK